MRSEKYIITEDSFSPPGADCKIKEYGEEFDPWWGWDTITLSVSEVLALIRGKVLETSVNSEYALLIRMEQEDVEDE